MAAPQPAPQERTQAYNPPGAQHGLGASSQTLYTAPPIPAEPARKPIWLLALILTLVAGGVTAGTLLLVRGRQQAVVSNQNPLVPSGPGVTQSSQPGQPGGPAVVSSRSGKPGAPGAPVTGAPGQPGSDMAPSVVMSQPGQPGAGPSVVQAPTGPATPGMPVTSAPNQQPRGAPVTGAPNRPAAPAAPVVSAPQLPKGADAFDRYLAWLHYVETERSKLSQQANMMAQQEYASFMNLLLQQASGDVTAEDDQRMMQLPARQMQSFQAVCNAQANFWVNMLRTKPAVPEDCRYLDLYYTDAGKIAIATAADLRAALARNNMGAVQTAARRQSLIDTNLRKAKQELEKVRDVRRLRFDWDIEVGGGGPSGLPSIPGLGF